MPAPGPPIARRDVVIAAVVGVLSFAFLAFLPDDSGEAAGPLAAAVYLLAVVPLLWRRRSPLVASAGILSGLAFHVLVFGTMSRCGIALPLLFIQAFAAGAHVPLRGSLAAVVTLIAGGAVMLWRDDSAGLDALSISIPITLAVWVIGRVVRSRSALATDLRGRNEQLRVARDERARLEVATDRLRLSGDLDELLRRRLAELARLADTGPGPDAGAALVTIERESRATLDEMRAVVGVLRGDEPSDGLGPQPTLTGLDALLVHAKGVDARLLVQGSPRVLPAGLELSAFRVVEHLLSTLDDAPGVEITVDFGDDALELTVAGPARRRSDVALQRARERVALHHGTLEATVRDGRARVVAAFPVLAPV